MKIVALRTRLRLFRLRTACQQKPVIDIFHLRTESGRYFISVDVTPAERIDTLYGDRSELDSGRVVLLKTCIAGAVIAAWSSVEPAQLQADATLLVDPGTRRKVGVGGH